MHGMLLWRSTGWDEEMFKVVFTTQAATRQAGETDTERGGGECHHILCVFSGLRRAQQREALTGENQSTSLPATLSSFCAHICYS